VELNGYEPRNGSGMLSRIETYCNISASSGTLLFKNSMSASSIAGSRSSNVSGHLVCDRKRHSGCVTCRPLNDCQNE